MSDEVKRLSPSRVALLGLFLLSFGTTGFFFIPGLIDDDATGTRLVNAFYCSAVTLTTVGFGDICPGSKLTISGRLFLLTYMIGGLGSFCGPVMELASVWQRQAPGGSATLLSFTVGVGTAIFVWFEGLDQLEAVYASIVTGTTIGYGDKTPSSDMGKVFVALYAIFAVQVMAGLLEPAKRALESLCHSPKQLPTETKRD